MRNTDNSASLEIMQVLFGGSLAFDILNQLVGEISLTGSAWMGSFFENCEIFSECGP